MQGCEKGWATTVVRRVSTERGTRFELATSSLGSWRALSRAPESMAIRNRNAATAGQKRARIGHQGVGEGVGA